ncbi:MAG: preQ(1) synthase [Verrucomicrobiota bacterium]
MTSKTPNNNSDNSAADIAAADRENLTLLGATETSYPESPEQARLEVFRNRYAGRDFRITFRCPEFTSRCPITNQPDFGAVTISYIPDQTCIESKSLKLYLFAFRNHNTFHEEAVNRILDDVVAACAPREARVEGVFNPRGGISIEVEAHYQAPAQ